MQHQGSDHVFPAPVFKDTVLGPLFDTVKVHMQADSSLGMMKTIAHIIKH